VICQFEKDEETVVWDSRRLMLPGADFVRIRRNQPFFSPDNPHDPVMFITGKNRRIEFPFVSKPSTEELVGIYLTSVKQQLINCL
jgi:hypothetical protein